MCNRIFATLLIVLFALPVHAGGKQLTIVFPTEKNAFHDAAAEILRQAYAALDVDVVYKTFPAERALQMSNNGHSDGELVRIKGIDTMYPNLIRIPVSHVTAEQMAFGRDASFVVNGWKSLEPHSLVFHRGYKVAEKNTEGMNRSIVVDDTTALIMVDKGRIDLAVANRFSGAKVIEEEGLMNVVMLTPPVQRDPLYHYVHSRHHDLVDDITRVLEVMEAEGEFARILEQFGVRSFSE
jgi:polar amino acid transport system substrate-binding protein